MSLEKTQLSEGKYKEKSQRRNFKRILHIYQMFCYVKYNRFLFSLLFWIIFSFHLLNISVKVEINKLASNK